MSGEVRTQEEFTDQVMNDREVVAAAETASAASKAFDSAVKAGQTAEEVGRLQASLKSANIQYIKTITDKAIDKNFFNGGERDELTRIANSIDEGVLDSVDSSSNTTQGKFKKYFCDGPLDQLKTWIDKTNENYTQSWFSKNKDKILKKLGTSLTEFLGVAVKWATIGGLAYWFLHTVQDEMTGCYQYDLVKGGSPLRVGDGICSEATCNCPMKQQGTIMPCASPPCQDAQGNQVYNYNWQKPSLFETMCNMLRTVTQTIGGGLDDILSPIKTYLFWGGIAILALIVLYVVYKIIEVFWDRSYYRSFDFKTKKNRLLN